MGTIWAPDGHRDLRPPLGAEKRGEPERPLPCNDDHLRNHGFLFDAAAGGWHLAPLYDMVPATSVAEERFLHLGVGEQGRLATLTNAMTRHGVFGLTRPQAVAHVERLCGVVREWNQHFEGAGVSGNDIDRVASAFRKPRSLGLAELTKT